MDYLCEPPLWDSPNISNQYPDLSFCAQNVYLKLGPCLILWVCAPFWIYMLIRTNVNKIKTSALLLAKTVSILLLIFIEVFNIARAVENSRTKIYFITPTILILTYILALVLVHLEKIKGLISSTLLFTFWTIFSLSMSISLRTTIIQQFYTKTTDLQDAVSFFSFYGLLLLMVFLSLFSENSTKKIKKRGNIRVEDEEDLLSVNEKQKLKLMPENYAPLLSKLTFWWINNLIIKGFKEPLTRDDLWKIDDSEASEYVTNKLETEWTKRTKSYLEKVRDRPELLNYSSNDAKSKRKIKKYIKGEKSLEQVELTVTPQVENIGTKEIALKKPSLTLCICRTFGGKFIAGAFIKVVQDLLMFTGPVIMNRLITFVRESNSAKNESITVGLFYTALLFITAFIQSFALQHYSYRMFIVGARVRTSIMNLIYKKSLKLSTSARKTATVGEMTNLMAVNAQMLADLTTYLNVIWSSPLQILIAVIMLYGQLGISAVIGVSTAFIIIPIDIKISKRIKKVQLSKQKQQDSRIKMMNEIISGIKILKFYGWEMSFKDIVGKIRFSEMKFYKKFGILAIFSNFCWMCSPLIVTVVSFGCFIFINGTNDFNANRVFVSLSLFNILRFPLTTLPSIISTIISAQVSIKRIGTFLLKEEINENDITYEKTPGVAVKVEKADLGWSHEDVLLKDLNLEIKTGKLVAIVGHVGCGKSSLLSGLLGEMHKHSGTINLNGQTAYVPQQAWIQNQTLKNNIIFKLNSHVNDELYQKVLETCSLVSDLKIMPAGDKTEIGEKGINLSGGQKQRISLARALYSNADIYILDDPLSAVDSHVGKHIFDNVIGPNGMLKEKTRIFVTNSLSFLSQTDEIIMLDNGTVVEIGSYDELVKKKDGQFNNFIQKFLENNEANKDEDDQELFSEAAASTSTKTETQVLTRRMSLSKSKNDAEMVAPKEQAGEKIIQKEKIETGNVKLSVLLAYLKACQLNWFIIFVIMFSSANIASVGSNLWLSVWTDSFEKAITNTTNSSFHSHLNEASNKMIPAYPVLFPFLIFCAIGFAQCVLTLCSDFVFLIMSVFSSNKLHDSMLFSILRSTLYFFESTPSGRIINRFSNDIDIAERRIPQSFMSLIRCVYSILFTVIVISSSTPFFLVAFVPILILYVLIQRYFVASMRQLKRMDLASKSPIFSHFSETLTGVSTIRAYRMQGNFIKKMENLVDENLLYFFPNNISNRWLALRLELIGNLIAVFAALFAVFSRHSLSPSIVGLSITYALNVSQNLNWLVRMSAEFETNITSVERIEEYCNTPHEKEWSIKETKPSSKWPNEGRIVFKSYSVKYREELENVLDNIDIEINPSEKIGIVGRTGAGKSSLSLGLFRMLELSAGDIFIDEINIKTLGLHDLRQKLTIIPQDPVIFSGTIRSNLDTFGIYSEEDLWDALEHVDLKTYVAGSEKKLEHECSEGGENLSVGQRQLICLARALLRKTKILILDEATASIDHNTDELIQKTIRTQFSDCTVLTVAHRLNTIMDSNRILVLEKGKIAEFDTPQNLLRNKNSKFYSMAKDAGLV